MVIDAILQVAAHWLKSCCNTMGWEDLTGWLPANFLNNNSIVVILFQRAFTLIIKLARQVWSLHLHIQWCLFRLTLFPAPPTMHPSWARTMLHWKRYHYHHPNIRHLPPTNLYMTDWWRDGGYEPVHSWIRSFPPHRFSPGLSTGGWWVTMLTCFHLALNGAISWLCIAPPCSVTTLFSASLHMFALRNVLASLGWDKSKNNECWAETDKQKQITTHSMNETGQHGTIWPAMYSPRRLTSPPHCYCTCTAVTVVMTNPTLNSAHCINKYT